MKYLLDTSTISDLGKGHASVVSRAFALPPDLIAVSTITIMEIEYGLVLNPGKIVNVRPKLTSFLKAIHVLPFTEEDARMAGTIRALLRKQGKPIGAYDILLAGCALAHNLIFVTSNTGEFSRIRELHIDDWRLGNA